MPMSPSAHKMGVMSPNSKNATKEVAPFLKNLRKMLEEESDEILRWTTNGRAFEIHDMERMMNYVLPKYFKHRKYTSFQRQLNYFNFRKWTKSKAVVCTFSNDFFLRDQPDLAWRITRKKSVQSSNSKPAGARKSTAASGRSGTMDASWKSNDMAITVPCAKMEHFGDPFPSPTDMDMMLLENEHDVGRYYSTPALHYAGETGADSLDWIDTFLPSLEVHPKIEDYTYPTVAMAARPAHYASAPPMFHTLPAPSDFGCRHVPF
ncbi:hypothetical protein ATCC90586_003931 [Pythium insidiosum]|nr:hypothetical protein ATCC90586_003931 [Pythium insidiosum]